MNLFRFDNPDYLYALGLIPVLFVLFLLYRAGIKRRLRKFSDEKLIPSLIPERSKLKATFKFIVFMLAYISLVIAAANPQMGTKLKEIKREGVEIMIAVDVSNSMKAEDIKPSRLEKAKHTITKLIDKLYNDRIGIIVFAGKSYLQMPLTTDYAAAKMIVSLLSTDIVQTQGTAIGSAIDLAMNSFSEDETKNKTIIVISDGENHEDDVLGKAEEAGDQGVVVHTIGMGSSEGAPIPVGRGKQTVYMKRSNGETVISKLDPTLLRQAASATDGEFILASRTEPNLKELIDKLSEMEKEEYETKRYTDYEDQFQYFIALSLILLVFEFVLSDSRNKIIAKLNEFAGGGK
mgnify:CR=1 FL=1